MSSGVSIKAMSPASPGIRFTQTDYESISGGAGGWEDIDRPRATSAVGWVGTPAKSVVLALELDGMEALGVGRDRSLEADCAAIEAWGLKTHATGVPPILRVSGLVTIKPSERWVVDTIEWGAYLRNSAGQRIQQDLTITLKRYAAAAVVLGPAAKARSKQPKKKTDSKKPKKATGLKKLDPKKWKNAL